MECTVDNKSDNGTLSRGQFIASTKIRDDNCDVNYNSEDEENCNILTYGIYCNISKNVNGNVQTYKKYIDLIKICNGDESCDCGEDELYSAVTNKTENSCKHEDTGALVLVHNYTRCATIHLQ